MKKLLYTLFFLLTLSSGTLLAQTVPQGINYQAVARDVNGQPLSNQEVLLRVELGDAEQGQVYYSETHEVTTDAAGYFAIVVGRGAANTGELSEVPWSEEQVWLHLDIYDPQASRFRVLSANELLAVPYAFFAEKAEQLVEDPRIDLRNNQSIYWTTTGNNFTRAPFHFLGTRDEKPLYFKTDDTERIIVTEEGQIQIIGGVDGASDEYEAYPLTVQGSKQGIYIKVNGERSSENHFVTFADGGPGVGPGQTWGAIKGQTVEELLSSFDYIWQNANFAVNIVSLTAKITASAIEAGGLLASTFAAGAAPGSAAKGVAFIAEAAGLAAQIAEFNTNAILNVGVTYSSGAGDYAEWLKRAPGVRPLNYGEVVGVHAGKVSLNTEGADHIMVVSMRPIVLGNEPQPGDRDQYEKIAFMGQVPVKVIGAVSLGDYILPSGNHDGTAIAVNPDDMLPGDYGRIIGVAWEAAKPAAINYVNVAVGINANDLSQKVDQLNRKVDNIIGYLEGKEPLRTGEEDGDQILVATPKNRPSTSFQKMYTDEEFDQLLDQNEPLLNYLFAEAKKEFVARGYNLSDFPGLQELFDHPLPAVKKLRRDPNLITQWAYVDQQFSGAQESKN